MRHYRQLWVPAIGLGFALAVPAYGAPPAPVPGTPYFLRTEASVPYAGCPNPTVLTRSALDVTFDLPLPFPFRFYEEARSRVTVSNHGALALPRSDVSAMTWALNQALGDQRPPHGVIAPWWDDLALFASSQGLIGYSVVGQAPHRAFCVEWKDVSADNGTASSDHRFATRVLLHEGPSGRIEILYSAVTGNPGVAVSASTGVEDSSGTRPVSWAPTDGRCGVGLARCTDDVLRDFANTRVTVLQDGGPDLVAMAVAGPPVAAQGQPMPVTLTVRNLHQQVIGPFEVRFDAASGPSMQGALPVASTQLRLQPFETRTLSVTGVVPAGLGLGRIWLRAQVDTSQVISEPDESNNAIVTAGSTLVVAAAADLDVRSVSVDRMLARPGDAISVEVHVGNAGSLPATAVPVAFMLSSNPVIGQMDIELRRAQVTLNPRRTVSLRQEVIIPRDLATGTYYVGVLADPDAQLDELHESNNRAASPPIRVEGGALRVLTAALPGGLVAQPYVARLEGLGGVPPLRWVLEQGRLPPGLTLDETTGALTGTPERAGTERFTVKLTSADDQGVTKALALSVVHDEGPLTIVTDSLPAAEAERAYVVLLAARGGGGQAQTWRADGLPMGLVLTPEGRLGGRVALPGFYPLEVEVQVGAARASRRLTLEVRPPATLRIVPLPLPPATWSIPYSTMLGAVGGRAPVTWFVRGGALPEGLQLSAVGTLEGTPREAGRFWIDVEAVDGGGSGAAASRDRERFLLTVLDGEGFEVVTRQLPDARVGALYQASVRARGGQAPLRWTLAEGRLPSGLSMQSASPDGSARLLGTPERDGTFNLLFEARDAQGRRAAHAVSLIVRTPEAPPAIARAGCRCTPPRGGAGWLGGWVLVGLAGLRRRRGGA